MTQKYSFTVPCSNPCSYVTKTTTSKTFEIRAEEVPHPSGLNGVRMFIDGMFIPEVEIHIISRHIGGPSYGKQTRNHVVFVDPELDRDMRAHLEAKR